MPGDTPKNSPVSQEWNPDAAFDPGAEARSNADDEDSGSRKDNKPATPSHAWVPEDEDWVPEYASDEVIDAAPEPETLHKPEAGQFDLAGNAIQPIEIWQPDAGVVKEPEPEEAGEKKQFDLFGNLIPAKGKSVPVSIKDSGGGEMWDPNAGAAEEGVTGKGLAAKSSQDVSDLVPLNVGRRGSKQDLLLPASKIRPDKRGKGNKREKRVSSRPPRSAQQNKVLYICIGIGVLVIGCATYLISVKAPNSEVLPVPDSYAQYIVPDQHVQIQRPVGWLTQPLTGGPQGISITKGVASIQISDEAAAPTAKLDTLHDDGKQALAAKYANYAEQPKLSFAIQAGDGRMSEWTAGGGFFHEKLHGYRVTILSAGRRVTVICACADNSWKTLKPAFAYVINGLAVAS